MKIITITGYKGGVGKTTTSIHLADFFSDFGKTILIDHDPNKSAKSWFDRSGSDIKFEVFDDKFPVKKTIGCDFVLLDLPANPEKKDILSISQDADLIILPTSPTRISYEPIIDILQLVDQNKSKILLTLVPKLPNKSGQEVLKEMQEEGLPVLDVLVKQTIGYDLSYRMGKTIRGIPDKNQKKFWNDYKTVGEILMGILNK